MLKVYKVKSYASINGAPYRRVGDTEHIASDKELISKQLFDNISFNECREYLSNHTLSGLCNSQVYDIFCRSKPSVEVEYTDTWEDVSYKHFNTLSYKYEVEEWTNVSLDWIIKNLSADECIQYLKERGMTTCPILK